MTAYPGRLCKECSMAQATEQMCRGFLSKLRAVEKPYPAACQEGITVHELVVTRARDGVHKLSEYIACSDCMLSHFVLHMGFLRKHLELPATPSYSIWLRICDQPPQKGKDAMSSISFHPPLLLVKDFCLSQERAYLIWGT